MEHNKIRKDSKNKNRPEFYGEDYLKGTGKVAQMSIGGGRTAPRWQNNRAFLGNAKLTSEFVKHHNLNNVLDVGCGRGWVVHNLRNLGIESDGCEYGNYAVDNSVCDAKFGDLTERLPYEDNTYDVILCKGVLSHLTVKDIPNALSELYRVTKKYLMTNILILEHKEQWYHITIEDVEWWLPYFEEAGFIYDIDETKRIKKEYNRNAIEQWFAIFRKDDV